MRAAASSSPSLGSTKAECPPYEVGCLPLLDRLTSATADARADCSDRRVGGCLDSLDGPPGAILSRFRPVRPRKRKGPAGLASRVWGLSPSVGVREGITSPPLGVARGAEDVRRGRRPEGHGRGPSMNRKLVRGFR